MIIYSRLMASGDFTIPFVIMMTGILVSTAIYWRVFRRLERALYNAGTKDEPRPASARVQGEVSPGPARRRPEPTS